MDAVGKHLSAIFAFVLELALLSHMFNVCIQRVGAVGPVYIRFESTKAFGGGGGGIDVWTADENAPGFLLNAVAAHSNPFLGYIVRVAIGTEMRSSEIPNLRRSQVRYFSAELSH